MRTNGPNGRFSRLSSVFPLHGYRAHDLSTRRALFLIFCIPSTLLAQSVSSPAFEFLSPVPNSRFASPQTNVIIRWGESIVRRSISEDAIRVIGSASGVCAGRVGFSDDERTILWTPASFFKGSERVTVEFGREIRTVTGTVVPPLKYSFVVSS